MKLLLTRAIATIAVCMTLSTHAADNVTATFSAELAPGACDVEFSTDNLDFGSFSYDDLVTVNETENTDVSGHSYRSWMALRTLSPISLTIDCPADSNVFVIASDLIPASSPSEHTANRSYGSEVGVGFTLRNPAGKEIGIVKFDFVDASPHAWQYGSTESWEMYSLHNYNHRGPFEGHHFRAEVLGGTPSVWSFEPSILFSLPAIEPDEQTVGRGELIVQLVF